jgi:GNAT superfamily N-acetyltransferase
MSPQYKLRLPREALREEEVITCFQAIKQLRPSLTKDEYLQRVAKQRTEGYRLAYIEVDSLVVCVAGFRILHNLAWGKFLYVDDLITDEKHRSRGYGKELVNWLRNEARTQGCSQLHLDSGIQRTDAHRFYSSEGLARTCFHFAENL